MLILLTILVLVNIHCVLSGSDFDIRIKAVSIFKADSENEYHKYAAVLAATEPFRLQCDVEIRKALNPLVYYFHKLKGTTLSDPTSSLRIDNRNIDNAFTKYESKVDEIVKTCGLDPNVFNNLSRQLVKQPILKQRVLLQAYYYKIAADLQSNVTPILPLLPTVNEASIFNTKARIAAKQQREQQAIKGATTIVDSENYLTEDTKFFRFVNAVRRVEMERLAQREMLQNELNIKELPERMCDPDLYPAMCSRLQDACSSFPKTVGTVVSQYGLGMDEFDKLNDKMKKNFFFRFKVQNAINKLEQKK